MKRTRIHVESVTVESAAASRLEPVRLRAELGHQIARALSATSSRGGTAYVPVVRVDAHAQSGSAGIARAVASALTRSVRSRKGTR
jgi:hypothetical protein